MSNELPNVGDLARVIETCVCEASRKFLGHYYTVARDCGLQDGVCDYCDRDIGRAHCVSFEGAPQSVVPRAWLRRVPPLANLESIDIADELDSERPRERVTA